MKKLLEKKYRARKWAFTTLSPASSLLKLEEEGCQYSYQVTEELGVAEYEDIYFTAHILRHTFACILYKAGIDIKQAQVWMGHKDIKVLLGIYTHLDSQDNQKSIDKVNQFLG